MVGSSPVLISTFDFSFSLYLFLGFSLVILGSCGGSFSPLGCAELQTPGEFNGVLSFFGVSRLWGICTIYEGYTETKG